MLPALVCVYSFVGFAICCACQAYCCTERYYLNARLARQRLAPGVLVAGPQRFMRTVFSKRQGEDTAQGGVVSFTEISS